MSLNGEAERNAHGAGDSADSWVVARLCENASSFIREVSSYGHTARRLLWY